MLICHVLYRFMSGQKSQASAAGDLWFLVEENDNID